MTGSQTQRRIFDQLDSTNAEALRLAQVGERGPVWIDAARQTLGRGRSGRHWTSEPGNLLTSFLFAPKAPMAALHQLSLLAGVAVFDAIALLAQHNRDQLRLKWPNDLMLGPAKAGGILIESSAFANDIVAIIGVGVNLATAPVVSGVATADLKGTLGENANLDRLRLSLAMTMEDWITAWSNGDGFSQIRAAWLKRGPELGTPLTIKVGSDVHAGQFSGLDDHGSLRITGANGQIQCYTFGDVTLPGHETI